MLNAYEVFNNLSEEDKKRKLMEKNLVGEKIDEFLKWYGENNRIAEKMQSPGGVLLLQTIWAKEIDVLKILLELGFGTYINQLNYGSSALHIAAGEGCLEFVKILCDIPKINIDLKNDHGKTALYLAIELDYPEISTFLLIRGAKTNIIANDNKSIIDIAEARGKGNIEITKLHINNIRDLWKQNSLHYIPRIEDVIENPKTTHIKPGQPQENNQLNTHKEKEEQARFLRQSSSLQILTIPDLQKTNREIFEKAQKYEATEEDFKKIERNPLYATVFNRRNKNPINTRELEYK